MKNFIANNIGYFAMLMAVIGFGSGPPFVTLALKEFFIIDLLAVRFLIAFFLMLFLCILMRVDISIKEVGLKPFLMGLLNPFLVTLSFHIGLLLTSPVNGVAIISTLPLMQPFVAKIFLNEKIEIKVIIGVFITLIGTYLLLTNQFKLGVGNYLGDLIIFLGMLCASTNEVIGEICNIRDVTEIKLKEKVEVELDQNKRLTQLVHARLEEERRVIARELHDELGQGITAIKTIGTAVAKKDGTSAETKENVETIVSVASTIYDGMHGIIRQLRPSSLDHLGLRDTLQDALDNWGGRYPNISSNVSLGRNIDGLSEDINITVYRVVQECLTNIVKHSEANQVDVEVSKNKITNAKNTVSELRIRVVDNGKGLLSWNEKETTRLGVIGMRERVQGLGGNFDIDEGPEGGVAVMACIPLSDL